MIAREVKRSGRGRYRSAFADRRARRCVRRRRQRLLRAPGDLRDRVTSEFVLIATHFIAAAIIVPTIAPTVALFLSVSGFLTAASAHVAGDPPAQPVTTCNLE